MIARLALIALFEMDGERVVRFRSVGWGSASHVQVPKEEGGINNQVRATRATMEIGVLLVLRSELSHRARLGRR